MENNIKELDCMGIDIKSKGYFPENGKSLKLIAEDTDNGTIYHNTNNCTHEHMTPEAIQERQNKLRDEFIKNQILIS